MNDQALITVIGFDHAAFESILYLFEPYFNNYTPWVGAKDGCRFARMKKTERRGRCRLTGAKSCLGLVLAWHRFKGSEYVLCAWFGFTGTCANVWLRFGRRMLMLALWMNPLARVSLPSDEKIKVLGNCW